MIAHVMSAFIFLLLLLIGAKVLISRKAEIKNEEYAAGYRDGFRTAASFNIPKDITGIKICKDGEWIDVSDLFIAKEED